MTRGLHWFRNDLRLSDNTALNALADRADQWLPVFVLDPRLLGGARAGASRTRFLLDCLARLARNLEARGVPLLVREGRPERILPALLHECRAELLSFNLAATPFGRRRDTAVQRAVARTGCEIIARRDDVIYAADEIRNATGSGYVVYTPYRNAWWKRWAHAPKPPDRLRRLPSAIPGVHGDVLPSADELSGAELAVALPKGGEEPAKRRLARFLERKAYRYHEDRDRPDLDGTSKLSPYLRFGALSARQCFARAEEVAHADPRASRGIHKWLDELIWREFYAAILEVHPRVADESFRVECDALAWNDDAEGFAAWCAGRTGFPIVDAGMRELRATGSMHNRLRMITACFLTKDLLIDWREGERFFFEQLVDADPASNNGGWQWAASTGADAQPYFRIFNPIAQGQRWDPQGTYVRRWIPELAGVPDAQIHAPWRAEPAPADYPSPIVDHAERRALALERYGDARERARGDDAGGRPPLRSLE